MRVRPRCTRSAGILVLWPLFLSLACSSPRQFDANPGIYDFMPPEGLLSVKTAIMDTGARDPVALEAGLRSLTSDFPFHLPLAFALQDAELLLLGIGREVRGVGPPDAATGVQAALSGAYRRRAEAAPDPVRLVLAARLEADREVAIALLVRAQRIDQQCIWAHYGRAHRLYAQGDFPGARAALDAALAIDSGHPSVLRLEASVLVRAGEDRSALAVLDYWLDVTEASPFVDRLARDQALVDQGILLVRTGQPEECLDSLEDVDANQAELARRLSAVRCAALADLGEIDRALDVAAEALAEFPGEVLASLHRALLLERADEGSTGSLAEERQQAWQAVLDAIRAEKVTDTGEQPLSTGGDDSLALGSLLVELATRARLARSAVGARDTP